MRDANGRTVTRHELELTAEVERLKAKHEAHERLMDERDRRYTERAEGDLRALEAALVSVKDQTASALLSVKEQTASSFAASKEAIVKAEDGQKSYNATHNDLTRKMDGQYATMLPRTEAESRFLGFDEKIADLREARSAVIGKDKQTVYLVGLVIVAVQIALHFFPLK